MRKNTIITSIIIASGVALGVGAVPAMADTTDPTVTQTLTADGTLTGTGKGTAPVLATVTGGALTAQVSGAALSGVTLDGLSAKHAKGVTGHTWTLIDARGTGAAWAVTVSASDFTSQADPATVGSVARTIEVGNLVVKSNTITVGGGDSTVPSSQTLTLSATGQTLVQGADSTAGGTAGNKGSYTLRPSFDLTVPVNAYRSNTDSANASVPFPFISTVTITIA